jgi:hypothetical protein
LTSLKKLSEFRTKIAEKETEIQKEQVKRDTTNSGYCFVVMKLSTDAVPL